MNDIRRTSAELTIPTTSFKNPPQVFADLRKLYPDIYLPARDTAWERISPFAYAYDHRAFDARYKGEIKLLLDGPLASALRLRHIEPIEDLPTYAAGMK